MHRTPRSHRGFKSEAIGVVSVIRIVEQNEKHESPLKQSLIDPA